MKKERIHKSPWKQSRSECNERTRYVMTITWYNFDDNGTILTIIVIEISLVKDIPIINKEGIDAAYYTRKKKKKKKKKKNKKEKAR